MSKHNGRNNIREEKTAAAIPFRAAGIDVLSARRASDFTCE